MTVFVVFKTLVVVVFFCNVEILLILQAPFFAILKNKNIPVDTYLLQLRYCVGYIT